MQDMETVLKECILEDLGKEWDELSPIEIERVEGFIAQLLEDHWDNYSFKFYNDLGDLKGGEDE